MKLSVKCQESESLIIIVGNIFTIFVFWKHRNRLKRTSFLLINLAVADLLVGFTELIALGPFDIAGHLEETSFNSARNANTSTAFQVTFSFASVLISLERAYALIWPLRHRVSTTKGYIYSATFAWVAATSSGILTCTIRHIGFLILDNCRRLRHGFVFGHDVRVLFDNSNKT